MIKKLLGDASHDNRRKFRRLLMLLYIPFLLIAAIVAYFVTPYLMDVSLILPEIDKRTYSSVRSLSNEVSKLTSSIESKLRNYQKEVQATNKLVLSLKQLDLAKTLEPLDCYEKKQKKVQKAPTKVQRTLLKFTYTLPLEITALMDGRKIAVIAGYLFREGESKVIEVKNNSLTEKVYVKVLKIDFNRAKVYVAPVNFKRKGKVVWLRRGENTVNISFYY